MAPEETERRSIFIERWGVFTPSHGYRRQLSDVIVIVSDAGSHRRQICRARNGSTRAHGQMKLQAKAERPAKLWAHRASKATLMAGRRDPPGDPGTHRGHGLGRKGRPACPAACTPQSRDPFCPSRARGQRAHQSAALRPARPPRPPRETHAPTAAGQGRRRCARTAPPPVCGAGSPLTWCTLRSFLTTRVRWSKRGR